MPVVAAVSGGGDSMALLVMLKRFWPGEIVVAHVEHGIRGRSSLEDADFVRRIARDLGCRVEVGHVEVPARKRKGESLEEAARRLRHAYLDAVRLQCGARWILLAHQADDQAETVLFHLFRGTGIRGLRGIPPLRPPFARPLLEFSGAELRAFLREEDIRWVEDETNVDRRFMRNRIRHQLLPLIRETMNSRVDEHLSALACEAQTVTCWLEERSRTYLEQLRKPCPGTMRCWNRAVTKGLSEMELCEAIRCEAASLGWPVLDRRRTQDLARLIHKGGRWTFQWKRNLSLASGQGLVGWGILPWEDVVPPGDLSQARGSVAGPFWTLSWENPRRLPFKLLSMSAAGVVPRQRQSIPWWLKGGWPVAVQGSTIIWCPFFDGALHLTAEPVPGLSLRLVLSRNGRKKPSDEL